MSFFFIAVFGVMVIAAMPVILKSLVTHWFESEGMTVQVGDIEISLWEPVLSINDFSGKDLAGKGFSLEKMKLKWQWGGVLDHRIVIDDFRVQSLHVDAELSEKKLIKIAGLNLFSSTQTVMPVLPEIAAPIWAIRLANSEVLDFSICMKQFDRVGDLSLDLCSQLKSLAWKGMAEYKSSNKSSRDLWELEGSLNLDGLRIDDKVRERPFLEVESILLDKIAVKSLADIEMATIRVEDFSVLQQQPTQVVKARPFFAFETLNLRDVQLVELLDLRVDMIELQSPSGYFRLIDNGLSELDAWGFLDKDTQTSPRQSATNKFRFLVNKFIGSTHKETVFVDERYQSPFTMTIKDVQWDIKKIHNQSLNQESSASLALTVGHHGYIAFEALGSLFSSHPTITGKGEIKGVDLKMMAPLTRKHLQHVINSGQLDSAVDFNVEKGLVNSVAHFSINQLALTPLDDKDGEAFSREYGFPLNASLALLRDRDNSIHLDVPVTGQVDSPSFDFDKAIVTAVSKAVLDAVIKYYTPYGLVFAADALVDLVHSLKLEPIVFNLASKELTSANKQQLIAISELMAVRPGIHITLCGISNQKDKESIFRGYMKSKFPRRYDKKGQSNTKLQRLRLIKIAEERSARVKNFLMQQQKVAASRLVECLPRYEPEGLAGVTITI
ncbi:MAG: DUF748 domain-containing protein [Methylococcales bacterium]|nr:DUF748 domain-containing protein [Methylococcales bacterium]